MAVGLETPPRQRGARALSFLESLVARSSAPAPSVGVVLVAWDQDRAQAAVRDISPWLEDEPVRRHAALVCNRPLQLEAGPTWTRLSGSNIAGEFSGYEEGVAALRRHAPDLWVLVNDRYAAYGGSPFHTFDTAFLHLVHKHRVLVGQRDALDRRVLVGRPELAQYIRTHYLVLSEETRQRLGSLQTYQLDQADDLLPHDWPLSEGTATKAPGSDQLDDGYLVFLRAWLTCQGVALPSHWYQASAHPARLRELRSKAISILNEHLLGLHALEAGIVPVERVMAYRSRGLHGHESSMLKELTRWSVERPSPDARGYRVGALGRTLLASARAASRGAWHRQDRHG